MFMQLHLYTLENHRVINPKSARHTMAMRRKGRRLNPAEPETVINEICADDVSDDEIMIPAPDESEEIYVNVEDSDTEDTLPVQTTSTTHTTSADWTKTDIVPVIAPFAGNSGLKIAVDSDSEPFLWLKVFLDEDLIKCIQRNPFNIRQVEEMSNAGSGAGSVKRHGGVSGQRLERSDIPSDVSQHSLPPHHHHYHHHYDPEWEAKEELRLRELEEARARAAQMEKTMRWWSDCTANWREKWSKVRTERNKAREEVRILRGKLEVASKETSMLKREKLDLEAEMDRLRKEVTLQSGKLSNNNKPEELNFLTSQVGERLPPERDVGPGDKPSDDTLCSPLRHGTLEVITSKTEVLNSSADLNQLSQTLNPDLAFLDKLLHQDIKDLNSPGNSSTSSSGDARDKKNSNRLSHRSIDEIVSPLQELTEQKVAMLQLRLDEAAKTILIERQEKNKLVKSMEKLQVELNQLRMKYEDIKKCRQDTLKELSQIKAEHQDELDSMRLDLEDEATTRSDLDQRLAELRSEELADLKHAHSKLKKVLQDKSTELAHALRRSEQYESEVKKLRGRIEELKKELASAEDEVDSATNNIRKLQRTNDELQEQVESLQVQVEHLQSRLRNSSNHILLTRHTSSLVQGDVLSEDDNVDY